MEGGDAAVVGREDDGETGAGAFEGSSDGRAALNSTQVAQTNLL
jgi:hypothetical protein